MNRRWGIGLLIAVGLGLAVFALLPASRPDPEPEPTATPARPSPERKVTRFEPTPSSVPGPIPKPVAPLPRPEPRIPKPVEPVRGIEADLARDVEDFLSLPLDPELPPNASPTEIHTTFRLDFDARAVEFAGLENRLKQVERDASEEEKRAARLARTRVRAALADDVRKIPPNPELPQPQVPTYKRKLEERASQIDDEARKLLDTLIEEDPTAAAEAQALRESLGL